MAQKMIISEKYKFIFIAVPKTATTSIENALSKYGTTIIDRTVDGKHKTAKEIREELGEEVWNQYFKFSFVRNPLSWTASWYNFRRRESLKDKDNPNHKNYTGNMTFEEFVKSDDWVVAGDGQSHWVTDEEGEIIVDFIGRFEDLQNDFDEVCSRIGIPILKLPSRNLSRNSKADCSYTDELRDIVKTRLSKDFRLFGYGATYKVDRLKGRTFLSYFKDTLKQQLRSFRNS